MSDVVMDGMKRIRTQDRYETRWILVGPLGAVDFHCANLRWLDEMRANLDCMDMPRSAGVEYHHRAKPTWMQARAGYPSQHCWILGGECWHDGTSLWAMEVWLPILERDGEDAIWTQLEQTYAAYAWPALVTTEGR